jgi:ribosomal protein S18 acetylase RimI-like enzyme
MLEDRYKGRMDKIELGVYQENSRAIRIYKKMGYRITQILDELHFYIMQKPLLSES